MALVSVPDEMTGDENGPETETEHENENEAVKVPLSSSTPPFVVPMTDKEPIDGSLQHESFGYMMLLLSAVGYSAMGLCLRIATGYHKFPVQCVLVIRGTLQTLLALSWITTLTDAKKSFSLSRRLVGLLFLRGLGGGVSMALSFYGLSRVPMGIFASIFFLSAFDQSATLWAT